MAKKVGREGTVWEYYNNGKIKSITYSDQHREEFDERGTLRMVSYPDGQFTEYDSYGQMRKRVLSDGTIYEYSAKGNLKNTIYPENKETQQEVNEKKLRREVDSVGTIVEYDENNKLKRAIETDGAIFYYDENGSVIRQIDSDGVIFEFGKNNILRRIVFPNGIIQEYDENFNLRKAFSPEGFITLLDEKGLELKMIKFDGIQGECIVDSEGNLQKTVWGDGSLWLYDKHRNREEYDENGKLRRKKWLEKNIIEEYDESGKLAKTIFPDGTVKEGDIHIRLKI